jgi:hypothetical protein
MLGKALIMKIMISNIIMNPIKYPRTSHLPWSQGVTSDDKLIQTLDTFVGRNVIVTEKMDGENTTMYSDHIHARSLDSKGGEDRAWVKNFWSTIKHKIPENYRICGENLWAKHSIHYTQLNSYFYGFSVWNDNTCLSWEDTQFFFDELGIVSVPVLYSGVWDHNRIKKLSDHLDLHRQEGYVVRLADEFSYDYFSTSVAKFVRVSHVTSDNHWRQSIIIPNLMI